MADEQTPTTEDVRLVYGPDSTGMLQDGTVAAFDRRLADHDREVAEKAWDEGFEAGWAECDDPGAFVNDVWDAKTPNPYREGGAS